MSKNLMGSDKFAVMRWLSDNDRLSVHHLMYVTSPKLPFEEFKPGMCGLSVFVGFPGEWKFRILNVGGKKEMTTWLKINFISLTADPTDKFCEETKIEDQKEKPEKSESLLRRSPRKSVKCDEIEDQKEKPEKIPEMADQKEKPEKSESLLRRSPRKSVKSDEIEDQKEKPEKSELLLRLTPRKSVKYDETPKTRRVENSEGSPMSHSPRKSLKFEGTGSNQYLSSRVDSSKKDAQGEKIKRLEEDNRSFRKKLRKLEERVAELEREKAEKTGNHFEKERVEKAGNKFEQERHVKNAQTEECKDKTGHVEKETSKVVETIPISKKEEMAVVSSEQDIEASVAGVVGDHNKFKSLCSLLFTEEELVSGTRTGKRTIKCMDNVKPQLDQVQFQKLETLVKKHTAYDKQTFQKKFENLQKILRRDKKEKENL